MVFGVSLVTREYKGIKRERRENWNFESRGKGQIRVQ